MRKRLVAFIALICAIAMGGGILLACSSSDPVKHKVTFSYNYAESDEDYLVYYIDDGATVSKPEDPYRGSAFEFQGWKVDAEGTADYNFSTKITADTTIYASWLQTEFTCKVTLDYNYEGGGSRVIQIEQGATIAQPDFVTRNNYNQVAWVTSADGDEEFDFSKPINSDVTIYAKWEERTITVNKIEGLDPDFIMGMDTSTVLALENSGVKFYDFNGNEKDVFQVLAENGINTIRIRIWNNPYTDESSKYGAGKPYGAGNCNVESAIAMGKRITAAGMSMMVDFHYSDFWADPGKQNAPKAWKDYTVAQKEEAIYNFTKDTLQQMKEQNIAVNSVQVGNETTSGMCGVYFKDSWADVCKLFNAGCRAVKEVYPEALRIIHFTNPERSGSYASYAKNLAENNVDYDVFGSSWYPFWHGTLDNLKKVLGDIATKYQKQVMVCEVATAYTYEDTDFHTNTVRPGVNSPYSVSVQGQADVIHDVIETIASTEGGIGICYWEGTWITVGGATKEENDALWEQYGGGWTTKYATEYDQNVGGSNGGNDADNRALFDKEGKPLQSLKTFKAVYSGLGVQSKNSAIYFKGEKSDWAPVKQSDIDKRSHSVSITLEVGANDVGKEFGLPVYDNDVESLEKELCWIGGKNNVAIGGQKIEVEYDVPETLDVSGNNMKAMGEGSYKFTITFGGDNYTPTKVTATFTPVGYALFNGEVQAGKLDREAHTVKIVYSASQDVVTAGTGVTFTLKKLSELDKVLATIGGQTGCKVGENAVQVTITDETEKFTVTGDTLVPTEAGVYSITIEFNDDNLTPKAVTISSVVYTLNFNGGSTGWKDTKIGDGVTIDMVNHTATFEMDFTDKDSGNFGFSINDPAIEGHSDLHWAWVGGKGNNLLFEKGTSNATKLPDVTITGTDKADMETAAGSKKRDFHMTQRVKYRFVITFEADNLSAKSIEVTRLTQPPVVDPSTITYGVYFSGFMNEWKPLAGAESKGGEVNKTTHIAEFNYTFTATGSFGIAVYASNDTTKEKCWIGGPDNCWHGTQITPTFTDNTGKFTRSSGAKGNINLSTAGTYKFTITFDEDNTTPLTVAIDNVSSEQPVDPPVDPPEDPDPPAAAAYALYLTGIPGWDGHVYLGDIDMTEHKAEIEFEVSKANTGFGLEVYAKGDNNANTGDLLTWIGYTGNIKNGTTLVNITITDNTGKVASNGRDKNLSFTEVGTYKVTIVFAEDNKTPVSITFDNVTAE